MTGRHSAIARIIKTKVLCPRAKLPTKATNGAACYDLYSSSPLTLEPGQSDLAGTGLAMEIPPGWELQIRTRSGMARKQQVVVLNSPGTIDSDYRGEIGVILINHSKERRVIEVGERIAQCKLARAEEASFEIVDQLSDTDRGSGGYGSTGR